MTSEELLIKTYASVERGQEVAQAIREGRHRVIGSEELLTKASGGRVLMKAKISRNGHRSE